MTRRRHTCPPARATCPVCKGHDVDCAFCLNIRTVTGAWRANYNKLLRTGTWDARIQDPATGEVLTFTVRHEDIQPEDAR